jgi:2-dehydro-3-deoxygalactonokinase
MPGTHPKWASALRGRILSFRTYMTGEVFAVLCAHSILGRMMDAAAEAPDWAAFDAGLARAGEADHLLHDLFSVRTLGLFERLPAKGVRDYLSGLLIGHETRAAASAARSPVALIGDHGLTQRYARALSKLGLTTVDIDEHIVVKGLVAIAHAAELLE